MIFLDECFTNKRFKTDKMINCTSFAPEATLEVSNKTLLSKNHITDIDV